MNTIIELIKSVEKTFDLSKIYLPIDEMGIDSLGLVTLRAEIEKTFGINIDDNDWYSFNTVEELIKYCETLTVVDRGEILKESINIKKNYEIDMPQMSNYALSENWLFKELGNNHWKLLSKGLGKTSSEITDVNGERLYATFVRIRFVNTSLRKFKENASFKTEGYITRYGNNNFLSNFECISKDNVIKSELMTTFSKRDGKDNFDLTKSSPKFSSIISETHEIPQFLTDFRLIKKDLNEFHNLDNEKIMLLKNNVYNINYSINPYYDLNGVGLLYFASYPPISEYIFLLWAPNASVST